MLTLRVSIVVLFGALSLSAQSSHEGMRESEPVFHVPRFQAAMNANHMPQPENRVLGASLPSSPQPDSTLNAAQTPGSRSKAIVYSNSYYTRAKIHKYASIATLPLFAAEAVVGQKLFDGSVSEDDSLRSVHSGLGAGIGILFGMNTVTGVWNMKDSWHDPNGRKKRLIHGILMLAADAGFVATAALAPHRERENFNSIDDASTHRAVAYGSLGIATAGYVYMLLAK